ncbi:phosphotransferase [Clostridium botulinum]|uniref:phosphotransferase n=1 Tax=Clostridium botulinum TaxID=1491 RepID=UPI001FD6F46B|nr:phosphotransferase [Clostridium botulinum]MCJ8174442.1 phosphotransferase [Clostridium botulinum]
MIKNNCEEGFENIVTIFLNYYNDEILNIERLKGASPTKSWRVDSTKKSYVLRKCVRNNDKEWLLFQNDLVEELYKRKYPVQPVIKTQEGQSIIFENECYWQLREYTSGRCYEMGNVDDELEAVHKLIELHNMDNLPKGPSNPNNSVEGWIFNTEFNMKKIELELCNCTDKSNAVNLMKKYWSILENTFKYITPNVYKSLPFAMTHGDYHGTNLIFKEKEIAAIIDLDTIEFRPRVFDLAVSSFMLTRKRRGSFELDLNSTKKFIKIYSSNNKLLNSEWLSIIPFLNLYFLPSADYLKLLRTNTDKGIEWYLKWTMDAYEAVQKQFSLIIEGRSL